MANLATNIQELVRPINLKELAGNLGVSTKEWTQSPLVMPIIDIAKPINAHPILMVNEIFL